MTAFPGTGNIPSSIGDVCCDVKFLHPQPAETEVPRVIPSKIEVVCAPALRPSFVQSSVCASGCDNLAETVATGPVSVNVLASTAYNVAVGGTVFNENGHDSTYWSANNNQGSFASALKYIPESVWNESCTSSSCGMNANIAAGGGGASGTNATFQVAKPSWQAGIAGIPSDGARDLPDVSLTAAGHDPYLICFQGSCIPDAQGFIHFAGIAGTSASTPSFAGIMALCHQSVGGASGSRITSSTNWPATKASTPDNAMDRTPRRRQTPPASSMTSPRVQTLCRGRVR